MQGNLNALLRLAGGVLLCALISTPLSAAKKSTGKHKRQQAPTSLCDIEVDPGMNLYKVMANGKPFKNKRYLTWDDALGLMHVLVSSGECKKAAPPKRCELKILAAGEYVIIRDGVNFDPFEKLRTLSAARNYAKKLAKAKLCKPIG